MTGRSSLKDLLAAGSVMLGLIFVGFEIRQNTQAVEGATVQAISDQALELTLAGFSDPVIQGAWERVVAGDRLGQFSEEERMKLAWYFAANVSTYGNAFRQVELGTIPGDALGEQFGDVVTYPAFADWWDFFVVGGGARGLSATFVEAIEAQLNADGGA